MLKNVNLWDFRYALVYLLFLNFNTGLGTQKANVTHNRDSDFWKKTKLGFKVISEGANNCQSKVVLTPSHLWQFPNPTEMT